MSSFLLMTANPGHIKKVMWVHPLFFDRSKTCYATKSNKTILLSQISNNCYQTHLILLHNLCSMCPSPVPTQKKSGYQRSCTSLSDMIAWSLKATSSLHMLRYRLVFVWVAKVDCVCSWIGEGGCCILRWSPASRINFRLKASAAS